MNGTVYKIIVLYRMESSIYWTLKNVEGSTFRNRAPILTFLVEFTIVLKAYVVSGNLHKHCNKQMDVARDNYISNGRVPY